jgi:hypothetical protein
LTIENIYSFIIYKRPHPFSFCKSSAYISITTCVTTGLSPRPTCYVLIVFNYYIFFLIMELWMLQQERSKAYECYNKKDQKLFWMDAANYFVLYFLEKRNLQVNFKL